MSHCAAILAILHAWGLVAPGSTLIAQQPRPPLVWISNNRLFVEHPTSVHLGDTSTLRFDLPRGHVNDAQQSLQFIKAIERPDGRYGVFVSDGSILSSWQNSIVSTGRSNDTCLQAVNDVEEIISKRGRWSDQLVARRKCSTSRFLKEDEQAVLRLWPLSLDDDLLLNPVDPFIQLPSIREFDNVTARWQLDKWDSKSVFVLCRLLLASTDESSPKVPKTGILKNAYVARFAELADAAARDARLSDPNGRFTYSSMIAYHAEVVLSRWRDDPSRTVELRINALQDSMRDWQNSGVGVVDRWTSLRYGIFDCDSLALVMAEALARAGWSAEFLNVSMSSSSTGPIRVGHVVLRVKLAEQGKTQESAALIDPMGFPIESIFRVTGGSQSLLREWNSLPASQPESSVNNEIVARWLSCRHPLD